jgi:hypothetical protein
LFFYFPDEEERRRRRQGNYIAKDALNLSDYGHRWKRGPLPSYASYDTGEFKIVCEGCQKFGGKTQTHKNSSKNSYFRPQVSKLYEGNGQT